MLTHRRHDSTCIKSQIINNVHGLLYNVVCQRQSLHLPYLGMVKKVGDNKQPELNHVFGNGDIIANLLLHKRHDIIIHKYK